MFAVTFDNPWIAAVEAARRRVPALAAVLLAAAWVALTLAVARLTAPAVWAAAADVAPALGTHWAMIAARSVRNAAIFTSLLLFALAAARFEGRSAWLAGWRPPAATFWGASLGACGLLSSVAIATLAGAVARGTATPLSLASIALGFFGFAFQTATEEVYFRGWLQPLCCARWGPWLGVAATAVLFALLHLVSGTRSPTAVASLVLGGLMFGLLALRSGGLWAPWAAHFTWNWLESGGLGLDPNPASPGSIISLTLKGSALWSGGPEGMNGSLATVIVLALIVASLVWARAVNRSVSEVASRQARSGT
ncbi:MAG: CPBP family intramembrane glutamic endopeptidase [Caulobacteraceae bacterium]|jgi:membrane protease YdiL (CAAX protease family)